MVQEAAEKSKPVAADVEDIRAHGEVTAEDILYSRTIRTVHSMATKLFSLGSVQDLLELQFENGLEISFKHCNIGGPGAGGLSDWLQAGATVFMRAERERAWKLNSVMQTLFPSGLPFGLMGDGSNDRSLREQETVVLRFLGPDGQPYDTFFDLAELDLKTSVDGHSPDSQCITACYSHALQQLNEFEGFLLHSDWRKALVGASFDGASVMLGAQNGVAAKLQGVAPQAVVIHAGAHVNQLAIGDCHTRVPSLSPSRLAFGPRPGP